MEIYPEQQFLLFLSSFTTGVLLGAFYEILRALRILFGVLPVPERLRPLYAKKLPVLKMCVPVRESRVRKIRRTAVVAVEDFLFLVIAAVAVEFLLYDYNCGEFRLSVPVLALCGFVFWRMSVARLCSWLTPYLAYVISAAGVYIKVLVQLPFRLVAKLLRFASAPLRAMISHAVNEKEKRVSEALCKEQLRFAAGGFGYFKKEGQTDVKNKTRKRKIDFCHQASDHTHLPRGTCHLGGTADGIQPQTTGGGRTGAGKRKV